MSTTTVEPNMAELRAAVLGMDAAGCRDALLILLGSAQRSKPVRQALASALGAETSPAEPSTPEQPVATEPVAAEPSGLATGPEGVFEDLETLADRIRAAAASPTIADVEAKALTVPAVSWCSSCLTGLPHTLHGELVGEIDDVRVKAFWEPGDGGLYPVPTLAVTGGDLAAGFQLDGPEDAESFARLMERLGQQRLADVIRLGIALISAPAQKGGDR